MKKSLPNTQSHQGGNIIVSKLNCWEFKKCGRQPGGQKSQEFGVCPAATLKKYHGVHDGSNGGRACWAIAGSYCGGHKQGVYAQKMLNCLRCDFFNVVKSEEEREMHGFVVTPIGMYLYLRQRLNGRTNGVLHDNKIEKRIIERDKICEIEILFLSVVGRAGVTIIDNVFAEMLYKRGADMTNNEFFYYVKYLLDCLNDQQRSEFLGKMPNAIVGILQRHHFAPLAGGLDADASRREY